MPAPSPKSIGTLVPVSSDATNELTRWISAVRS